MMEHETYERLVQKAKDPIVMRDGFAEVYATLAVADRLDRLCEILSKRH